MHDLVLAEENGPSVDVLTLELQQEVVYELTFARTVVESQG